jgi:outer membrane protein insertion porin family/translocation and assembly module TamA
MGFLFSSNYGKNWNSELEGSATTTAPPVVGSNLAAYQAARVQLEHDTQIMFFRGFFSGGPTTNRGFPLLGVAPHGVVPFLNPGTASQQVQFNCDPGQPGFNQANADKCFLPVGGYTLWELQNELRADISGPLSGSIFCDMSDVSPHETDIRLSHLHLSCGLGAAYDTPVGPIRVNVGYRIQPLQVLGYSSEVAAAEGDPVNGAQPTIFGVPLAVAIGIGQAY